MRATFVATLVLVMSIQLVGTALAAPGRTSEPGHDHSGHDHARAELPTPNPARGVVNRGLVVATEGPCLGLLEVVDVPGSVCTHGPDAAPAELGDVRVAGFDADQTLEEASTAAPFTCDGDGVSGRRAHAIYAVTADRTDRFARYEEAFKAVIASVQDEYRQSSLLHGATDPAVFRFTHTTPGDGTCEPLLDHVVLPDPTDDDSFGATINALTELGYTDPSRRYLVFADANLLCGIAQLYGDDRADPAKNYNNVEHKPLFSRVDAGCWGYAETHELTHNIGGVQSSAPNASGAGHCNDDHDLMCYSDGGKLSALFIADECGLKSLWERRLDCNGDDYFNPAPPAGSYLDGHWNTWNSGWLFREVAATDDGSTDTTTTDDTTGDTASDGDEVAPPSNPPTVTITAPAAGAIESTVTFRGKASDVDGDLAAVRLFVDGKRIASLAASSLSDGRWSKGLALQPGEHVLSARSVDDQGNTSTGASVTVTVTAIVEHGPGKYYYLSNGLRGGEADEAFGYGRRDDQVLVGDWNGDRRDTLAVRRGSWFYLSNDFRGGAADTVFKYGRPDDEVFVGDWDGDGVDTLAVRRGSTFYVTNALRGGAAERVFQYGRKGDVVLVGDWDGDGDDTFAVRRGRTYYIDNDLRGGKADTTFVYGRLGDLVYVGDWDGNGTDTLGVRRGRTYYLNNHLRGGVADVTFRYGWSTDITLVGDWDGRRGDTLGVRRIAAP